MFSLQKGDSRELTVSQTKFCADGATDGMSHLWGFQLISFVDKQPQIKTVDKKLLKERGRPRFLQTPGCTDINANTRWKY